MALTRPASAGFFISNLANLGYFHPMMTPETLQHCLNDIGWTPDMLARKLECHVSLVDAWLSGELETPLKASAWLTTLAACHRAAEERRPVSLKGKKAPL